MNGSHNVRRWLRGYVLPSERKRMAENETPSKNPPIKKFRVANITACIWQREHNDKIFHNVTLERSYKDGEEWKSSGSFGFDDMGPLELALELAKKYLASLITAQNADRPS